ncbi:MAG: diguanylate cyclase domain-containing protein [Desulfococcaceae bacterium]
MRLRLGPVPIDYILFFLILTGVSLFLLRDRNLREQAHFELSQQQVAADLAAGLYCQRDLSRIVMENRIQTPRMAEILSRAVDNPAPSARAELREDLYRLLAADFQHIRKIGFDILHFHLPDQTSFLRFHAPEKSSDRLATRTMLPEVIRDGEMKEGFEIGPLFSGYTFIYPVRHMDRIVGSVEVGVPLHAFQENLNRAFPAHYRFLVNEAVVQTLARKKREKWLAESGLGKRFFEVASPEPAAVARERRGPPPETVAAINARIRERADAGLRVRENFSVPARLGSRNYLVSFVAMSDNPQDSLLFLAAYREDRTLESFRWSMLITLGMTVTLLGVLMAVHLWTGRRIRRGEQTIIALRRDLDHESQNRRIAEEARDHAQQRLDAMGRACMDALVLIDAGGRVVFWNAAAEKIFGYAAEEAMGKSLHELVSPARMREKAQNRMEIFARTGEGRSIGRVVEMPALRKNGLEFPAYLSTQALRMEDRWWAAAAVRDITDQKRAEEQLLELQTTDSLTGLPNRSRFLGLLSREIARSRRYDRPLSLLLIDVDGFSRINRLHGRKVGDHLLRTLADLIGNGIRTVDISARLGDGEIGLVLTDTEIEQAEVAAERFRKRAIDTLIPTGGEEAATFTISVGVAAMDGRIRDVETFMNRAETALSQAKVQGRNCVVLAEKSTESIVSEDDEEEKERKDRE